MFVLVLFHSGTCRQPVHLKERVCTRDWTGCLTSSLSAKGVAVYFGHNQRSHYQDGAQLGKRTLDEL